MKRVIIVLASFVLLGCSYGKQHVEYMLDNPPDMLEDPLYVDYEARMNALEKQYLNKEISYAEYVEKKKELEDHYTQESQKRSAIVEGNE